MTQPLTISDFRDRALAAFPELAPDFEPVAEYPTAVAGLFAERLQRAKGEADWDRYEHGIALVAELLEHAAPELEFSLRWTVMKHLTFDGPRGPIAWEYLGPERQRVWTATHDQLAKLTEPPKNAKRSKRRRR